MLHKKREIYLENSLKLGEKEVTMIEEFVNWLPDDIIDCHAHCNLPEHVEGMQEKTYRHMLSTNE